MVKVLAVLYDGGQHAKDVPGLLGTTENELGIRKWLEDQGHTLVTTSDKDREGSKFDEELVDAEIIITTPFHPGYLTAERLAKAKKLKLAVTAGIGSDHVDLNAANKTNGGITVAEVTGSNVVSVAEHVLMTILVLIRNFVPAHEQIERGEWDVAAAAKQEYDLEGKVVGTVAVGRIGERVLRRLKPFDCKELLYYDYQPLSPEKEKEIGCRRVDTLEELLAQCDIVTINCPLHEKTKGLFNKDLIAKMKKGSYLVNTARGAMRRFATARRDTRPTIHRDADGDEGEDEDDDDDAFEVAHERLEPRESAKSVLKKRKRASFDHEEDDESEVNEDRSRGHPTPKQPPRAVRERLAKDDAEIEQLERKLGLKKGRKSLPKAFRDDGLDDLLGDLGGGSDSDAGTDGQSNEAKEWLAQKRRKATGGRSEADDAMDLVDDGLLSDNHDLTDPDEKEDYDDDDDEDDEDDDAWNQAADEPDSDVGGAALSDHDSFQGFDSEAEETAQPAKRARENPYLPPVPLGTQSFKYIPPSLRARSGGDADLEAQIRRKLQGPVNRVAEANMISIVGEIEKLYRDHPRGHINSILTGLLMAQVCDPTSKPDTLLVLSAGFIAAIYKIIGVDFAAHFLTTSVERFQEERKKAVVAAKEQRIPTKETSNLITVLAEMYIFRVISSNLLFDLVRLLLGDLSELNAELLLRIVRVAGPQLRKDDPLALKDIVSLIRPAVVKIGESNLTVRTKFMIETISDLKNNKLKAGAQDLVILNEHVTRMKKLLGSLDTQKLRATEPLRIGLRDIENADKTGKWWLVGASWAGSGAHGTKQEGAPVAVATSGPDQPTVDGRDNDGVLVADADDMVTPDYGQLAREQGMNTDVRRAIFIALVAAADYQDAYMRILKLRLNKYNRREVPNVLIQCSGAQQHYNPYYTLVAKKFCSDSRIKYAFQDTVWTLFRRLGEPLFGEEPEEEDEETADDRRLINIAKMMGGLVADGSLGLGILKPLNLAYVKETTGLFVEVMLITVLQECNRAKHKTMEQALETPFGSGLTPELARSVGYFLRKKVRDTDLVDGKKDAKKVRQACKVAEALLEKPALDEEK